MNLVSLQLHWTKKNYVRVLTKIHRMPPKKGMGKKKTFFPIMLIQMVAHCWNMGLGGGRQAGAKEAGRDPRVT